MNGFHERGLDEDNFGSSALTAVRAFDAFPKVKTSYTTSTRNGGLWTVVLSLVTAWLVSTEMSRWWTGTTSHTFSVEKGVAQTMEINLDVVINMPCGDLHVNIQDASGDRILASEMLHKERTLWDTWSSSRTNPVSLFGNGKANDKWGKAESWRQEQTKQYEDETDVHVFLQAAGYKRKFARTPRVKSSDEDKAKACRIFGTVQSNKVQADFHITARGHGYNDFGQHIDHSSFNFSHHINELSFGRFYPALHNPLDSTELLAEQSFYKYQYYLSIVPTIYTDAPDKLNSMDLAMLYSKNFNPRHYEPHTIFTNQYAVTEQSHAVSEQSVPGIFFKYDIEPILLVVSEHWGGILGLVIKLVNVTAGVLVAGSWLVMLAEYAGDGIWKRRRGGSLSSQEGLLHGRSGEKKM